MDGVESFVFALKGEASSRPLAPRFKIRMCVVSPWRCSQSEKCPVRTNGISPTSGVLGELGKTCLDCKRSRPPLGCSHSKRHLPAYGQHNSRFIQASYTLLGSLKVKRTVRISIHSAKPRPCTILFTSCRILQAHRCPYQRVSFFSLVLVIIWMLCRRHGYTLNFNS